LEDSVIRGVRPLSVTPRGDLARYVASLEVDASGAIGLESRILPPDGQAVLAFQIAAPVTSAGLPADKTGGYILGPRTYAKAVPNPRLVIVVRFRPGGAFPFLGVPMHELENRAEPLAEFWGADGTRLDERLARITTADRRPDDVERWLRVVEDALLARMRRPEFATSATADAAQRAVQAIMAAPETPDLRAVATGIGVSDRHMRRIFDEAVGMGPKAFSKVVRFQRAVRAAERSEAPSWGAIACEAGYYDQSHMIADFRRFTGTTPATFVAASRTIEGAPERGIRAGLDASLACAPHAGNGSRGPRRS
jgi:AraC-like DNA-binding protein